MKKTIDVITITLILSLILCVSACGEKRENRKFESGAYTSSTFDIPQRDGYEAQLRSVLRDADKVCISIVYTKYDDNGTIADQYTDIHTVDDSGERIHTLELDGDQSPSVVLENEYAFLGYNKETVGETGKNPVDIHRTAVFLDKKTGSFLRAIETDFQPYYIAPISDGFVIVGASTIARYSDDGELRNTVKTDFSCYVDRVGFFEDNGKYYVIEEKELGDLIYHEVLFETGSCPSLVRSIDIGVDGMNVAEQYYFNPDGEYKVNLSEMQTECLADWNCIDIQPPKKALNSLSQKYQLDDERFAISYEYRDRSAEVLLFHYDPSIDRSQIETITIGGYGVYDDPVLQWTVYTFNTSNQDYRVVLEDYGERFELDSQENRKKTNLALTQYFNDGNTPDIFYGPRFDYAYMGRNGMVVDMVDYINSMEQSDSIMTDASQRLMYDANGACYQLFSGYVMHGYYIQESVLEAVTDTSIRSLYQYAESQGIPYSVTSAANIVDEGIRYNFADLFGAYDGKKKITREDLETIVSIALSLPASNNHYADEEDVKNGRALMTPAIGYCYISAENAGMDSFHYIGFPSIHDSVHLAVPQSCMAISTTAKNKDICWKVLATLLSDNAQKQTILSGYIPVTQKALDIFCELALHPESVTDDVLTGCITGDKGIDQADVDAFLKEISTVDTIATYDWGLFDIIRDEINSYYSQNRSPAQITGTLEQRLTLYMQENYQ